MSAPDPRLLVISPFDKSTLGDIERSASRASDLGLTPANDGKVIRISIPPLTEERRKELVKQVRKMAEGHKVGMREGAPGGHLHAQGHGERRLPSDRDDRHRADKQVQDLTDDYTKKVDEMTAQKEKEVLEV